MTSPTNLSAARAAWGKYGSGLRDDPGTSWNDFYAGYLAALATRAGGEERYVPKVGDRVECDDTASDGMGGDRAVVIRGVVIEPRDRQDANTVRVRDDADGIVGQYSVKALRPLPAPPDVAALREAYIDSLARYTTTLGDDRAENADAVAAAHRLLSALSGSSPKGGACG